MASQDRGDLIVVTGGAGFIGSNIVLDLARRGRRVVVCDLMRSGEKWRNIAAAGLYDLIRPEALFDWLARRGEEVSAIVHMAAISSTTERDIDRLAASNIRLTLDLWDWCAAHRSRLIYASSAATYGDGGAGFADEATPEALARLAPLNAYGWSKHLVDRRIIDDVAHGRPAPRQWAGLKFFNVYGPNEAHKGPMQSVLSKIYPLVKAGEVVTLFKSHNPRYADGGQMRDFIHVADGVAIVRWLLANPGVSGLFNAGTGVARSFCDLVAALGAALGREPKMRFVDTPAEIRDKYQYFTQAEMDKLRRAGYAAPLRALEEGVREFVESAA